MQRSRNEETLCFICDYWWALLLALAVILAALLTNGFGLLPTPEPIPTAAPTRKLGSGDVQITLRWSNLNDLDLHVYDPNNEEIFYSHPNSLSRGTLDVDSNAGCARQITDAPVENVYWPQGQAPVGSYRVAVQYYAHCPGITAVSPFRLRLLLNGVEKEFTGQVTAQGELVTVTTFTFTR